MPSVYGVSPPAKNSLEIEKLKKFDKMLDMNTVDVKKILWGTIIKEPSYISRAKSAFSREYQITKRDLSKNKRGIGIDLLTSFLGKTLGIPGVSEIMHIAFQDYADQKNAKRNEAKISSDTIPESKKLKLEASNLTSVFVKDFQYALENFFSVCEKYKEIKVNDRPIPSNCAELKNEIQNRLSVLYAYKQVMRTSSYLIRYIRDVRNALDQTMNKDWVLAHHSAVKGLNNRKVDNNHKECKGKECLAREQGNKLLNKKHNMKEGFPTSFVPGKLFRGLKLGALEPEQSPFPETESKT